MPATIETTTQFRTALESGPYAWPGGYPLFGVTADGAALSFAAMQESQEEIEESIEGGLDDGWRVIGVQVNWEDPALHCDHTGERIESAYAEDD